MRDEIGTQRQIRCLANPQYSTFRPTDYGFLHLSVSVRDPVVRASGGWGRNSQFADVDTVPPRRPGPTWKGASRRRISKSWRPGIARLLPDFALNSLPGLPPRIFPGTANLQLPRAGPRRHLPSLFD